jgi:hypothetical protein
VTLVTIALAPSLTACGENTKAPTEQPTVKKTEPASTTDPVKTTEPVKKSQPSEIARSGFFTPSRNIRCEFASDEEGQALRAT